MDLNVPLVAAASVFGLFVLYRFRPAFSKAGAATAILKDAQKKLDLAKTDDERAAALAEAGDASAAIIGRAGSAVGFYLRAMRANPASAELVERAATALARRPRALESLLWRRLAAETWDGSKKAPAVASLRHLIRIYDGPVKQRMRARALEHMLESLGEKAQAAAPAK